MALGLSYILAVCVKLAEKGSQVEQLVFPSLE